MYMYIYMISRQFAFTICREKMERLQSTERYVKNDYILTQNLGDVMNIIPASFYFNHLFLYYIEQNSQN